MTSSSDVQYEEPEWLLPFDVMEVGDSFFIPTMKPAYLTYNIDSCAKKSGVKVKIFTVTENGVLGIRVWRTT